MLHFRQSRICLPKGGFTTIDGILAAARRLPSGPDLSCYAPAMELTGPGDCARCVAGSAEASREHAVQPGETDLKASRNR
jgi:hypothetical protein